MEIEFLAAVGTSPQTELHHPLGETPAPPEGTFGSDRVEPASKIPPGPGPSVRRVLKTHTKPEGDLNGLARQTASMTC